MSWPNLGELHSYFRGEVVDRSGKVALPFRTDVFIQCCLNGVSSWMVIVFLKDTDVVVDGCTLAVVHLQFVSV